MKIYGHPWSINTRKTLATLAEKGHEAALHLVMIPTGEHKQPAHLRVHPFGKVPVLDDGGFLLYETRAINTYLDGKLTGPKLVPIDVRERARMDQWINVADSYFIPYAHPMIVELLFRRYLGGEQNAQTIAAGRANLATALDAIDKHLTSAPFLAGEVFSLADIHWSPYLDYMTRVGEGGAIEARPHVRAWWARVAGRAAWQKVSRTGPQPDEAGMTADVIEKQYRR